MHSINLTSKFNKVIFLVFLVVGMNHSAAFASEDKTLKALDNAKKAFIAQDYPQMWAELDTITAWLEANSPRSSLSWSQAQTLIKNWVKKNWRKEALEITALSGGGMESTTERHQGSFRGYTWDTGERTVTTNFVFAASFKALDSKGKMRTHKVRFHFDKGTSGWIISRGGVM